MGLEEVVVRAGAAVVAADRDPERPVLPAADTEGERDAGAVTVRRDDQWRPERHRCSVGAGPGVHADDPSGALVEQRTGHGGPLVQPGTDLHRVAGQQVVEVKPRTDQAVVGPARQLRPGQLQADAAADDAKPPVTGPSGHGRGVETHVHEAANGPRGQPVATDLLAGEGRLLQQEHVEPGAGEMVGGRGATGTRADHDDVGVGLRPAGRTVIPCPRHGHELLRIC